MSVIFTTDEGWIISHAKYLNDMYQIVQDGEIFYSLIFNKTLFDINSQYLRQNQVLQITPEEEIQSPTKSKKRKKSKSLLDQNSSEINYVKTTFEKLMASAKVAGLFMETTTPDNNQAARAASQEFYKDTVTNEDENFYGCNETDMAIVSEMHGKKYVFPQKCKFYCYDVKQLANKIALNNQYDFILLDPPWWNKSIRRKKIKYAEASYKMMYNEDLVKLPIGKLLAKNGIVAMWCTNAPSHLHSIFNEIFPSWGVAYKAKWYWMKVTQAGDTICNFNSSHGKQPYELVVLGSVIGNELKIPDGKVIVSIPSAVHSHKPPLNEVLNPYLPKSPKCLEIFSRYLLSGWTSWGLEVLKFQHLSLYSTTGEMKGVKGSINNTL